MHTLAYVTKIIKLSKLQKKPNSTTFTVNRHIIFCFACGRAVIIQISNEHNRTFKVPL